jgi:hypothetical protein
MSIADSNRARTHDLVGQRFGNLQVVARHGWTSGKRSEPAWLCICDCGNEKIASGNALRANPGTRSCGCFKRSVGKDNLINIASGQRFAKLTVIGRSQRKDSKRTVFWDCRCDCGNLCTASGPRLRNGTSKSCGCLKIEALRIKATKHGGTAPGAMRRLYRIWTGMKARCTNPNVVSWQYYGARDIAVCIEWQRDFTIFRDWALTNGYQQGLTIDRKDNGRGYEPDNCRWATSREQRINQRPKAHD